jgi:hypothetical protein
VCTPAGLPVTWALADPKIDERQVLAALIDNEPHLAADRPGLLILADKGYIAAELDRFLAARGISLLRPSSRNRGTPRPGESLLKTVRQLIESVNDTLKGQLDLEQHGGRTIEGRRPGGPADPGDDLRDLAQPRHRRTRHEVTHRLRPLSHIGTTRLGDAQATERYSEEWLAELAHLPGKLSHLLTATSYLLALPRIRLSLRAARRTTPTRLSLEELLPSQTPIHWDPRGVTMNWAHQAEAAFHLLHAILNKNPHVRNSLHFLVGPVGCGKTTLAHWLHDELVRNNKKIHYVWAPAWVHQQRPIHLSAQMRDRLIQASQEVDLLMVDEADQVTIQALEALRLPCPVLVLGQTGEQFGEVNHFPTTAGIVVGMGPIPDTWRATPRAS